MKAGHILAIPLQHPDEGPLPAEFEVEMPLGAEVLDVVCGLAKQAFLLISASPDGRVCRRKFFAVRVGEERPMWADYVGYVELRDGRVTIFDPRAQR